MAPGMKIVVAPNAFKGTLTAPQAAAAIARGVREVFPQAEVVEVPVADGGDGTMEAIVSAKHGEYRTAVVEGPLRDPVQAHAGLIESGGAALARLERIDPSGFDPAWRTVAVKVACDVTNPLTGPGGASAVYGPQKGADAQAVRELDAALGRLAAVIQRDLGKSVADIPGAGAAGGTGAGLVAFLDASLVPGAPLVVDAAGLDAKLRG